METFVTLAIPALLTLSVLRLLFLPMKTVCKTGLYSAGGFLCLWLLNRSGMSLPLNPLTVLVAGFGGVPGIGLIALLSFF